MFDQNQLLDDSQRFSPNRYNCNDIIFISKETQIAFSVRSLLGTYPDITIDTEETFTSRGGASGILLAPLGQYKAPLNPVLRALWNIYKRIEPIVILHESRHVKQMQRPLGSGVENDERDAWQYAIKFFRELRRKGLDIIPDLKNSQIISRSELGLLVYDMSVFHEHRNEYNSSSLRRLLSEEGFTFNEYTIKVLVALVNILRSDPSVVFDAVSYRGNRRY